MILLVTGLIMAPREIGVDAGWAPIKECVYGSLDHRVLPMLLDDARFQARQFEVIRPPYSVPCVVGDSFQCAHQPLRRV